MKTHEIDELLRRHPFFAGLDDETLEFIAGCGTNTRFGAGDYVFREGGRADRFFLVRAGRVALEIATPDREPLVIDTIGEGDILGISWLFPPYRWSFDARAVELTRAVSLDGTCLREKCDAEPALGYELMKRLAAIMRRRMRSARIRLLDIYSDARSG